MKKALLSLNGECDSDFLIRVYRNVSPDIVIGVDGGTNHLKMAGIEPDVIVGDMDSYSGSDGNLIVYPEDKDEIDAELALDLVFERGCNEAFVTCWRGERVDMEYALLLLLTKYPPFSVKLLTNKCVVFYVSGEFSLEAKAGEKWSILPVGGDALVTLKGFKYEIENTLMTHKKPYGVSNVALKEKVTVKTRKGGVIVTRWLKEPS